MTLGRIQYTEQLFFSSSFILLGDFTLALFHKWIIEGAICYIELACVVPLSGGETVYIKVLIFISEAVNNCVSLGRAWRLVRIRLLLVASTGKNTFKKLIVRNVFRKSSIHNGGPCNLSNPR